MLFLVNDLGVPSVAKFVLLNRSGSNPAPTVTTISPSSGSASGGTAVTITGTEFVAGATHEGQGGTAATGVTVVSSTSITATTAAHAAGTVERGGDEHGRPEWDLVGWLYLYLFGRWRRHQFRAGEIGGGDFRGFGGHHLCCANCGRLECGGSDVGRHDSTVSSVTDSKGNIYALAVGPTKATGLTSAIYYAKNIIAGGSNTVTVKFNQTAGWPNVNVLEYSGLDTANPLDVKAAAIGTGTTANSGSATTTSANELIVGAGNPTSVFTAAGSGFSNRIINSFGGISEDKIVSSPGSYNATATLTSGGWVMQMATFRASGQGGSNPAPTVTTISPSSGSASGGTAVTITGTGFVAGATVSLGGTAATGVTVVSSTSITATTAAHAAGTVNVVVTNTDGQSGTLSGGYTYTSSGGGGGISFVQVKSAAVTSGASVAITFAAQTAGDLMWWQ